MKTLGARGWLLVVALAGLALAAAFTCHQRHHGGMAGLVARLGLDDATRDAVEDLLDEAHQRRRALRPQRREAHQEMRELMEAEEPDEAAIMAVVDRLAALENEARKERIRTLLRVRELLPPEARSELLRQMRRHEGPGHRRGFHSRW